MASFDIKSLFTMISLAEIINWVCKKYAETHGPNDENFICKLLVQCVCNVPFLYSENWYYQVGGVSMGSPLVPTLANLFMCHFEKMISSYQGSEPLYYKTQTYFNIFRQRWFTTIFSMLNYLHNNKFTYEEEENQIAFFHILI